jgi:hypothetical protein
MTFALIKWLHLYISSVKENKIHVLYPDWLVVNARVIECFSLAVTNEIALFATDYRRYIISTLISPSIVRKARPQNKDTVLASVRLRGIPSCTSAILNIKGEYLSNAHWLGPWRKHFDDELRLRQNRWKIIGKTNKSGFCVVYSVARHRDKYFFYN